MSIVKQLDKRSGITYAYESLSRWDKEKKQSRSIRKLIGRVDEKTGEIVATDGRGRKEIASQRSSELFAGITEEQKQKFFRCLPKSRFFIQRILNRCWIISSRIMKRY